MAVKSNKSNGGKKASSSKSRPASTSQLSAPVDTSAASPRKIPRSSSPFKGSQSTQRYTEAGNTAAQRQNQNATVAGANGILPGPDDLDLLTDDQANLDATVEDLDEPSLGQRLKGIKVGSARNGLTRAEDDDDEEENEEDRVALPLGSLSLGQTLTQALHSNDSSLLSSCLAHSDPAVIRSSVTRLSGPLAVKLLEHCVDRMSRGGKRSAGALGSARTRGIIEWIRATLIAHTGYLMSLPNLVHRLSALHGTLSSRLAAHEKLLALNGRLELVLGQIEMRSAYTAEQAHRIQGVKSKTKGKDASAVDSAAQKRKQMEGQQWVEESSDEENDGDNAMSVDGDDDDDDAESSDASDEQDDIVRGEEEGITQDIALGNDTLANTSIDSEGEEAADDDDESGEDVNMSGDDDEDEEDEEEDDDEEEEDASDESALDEEGDSDDVDDEEEEDSDVNRGGLLDMEAESTDGDGEESDESEE